MNYIKNVFVFLLFSLSSLAALAMPSVVDVETTIASGDYTKAKVQLAEVLKAHPDSYVANRYMLEIIKIENTRDNVASVGYKIYEDKLAKIEADKVARLEKIRKAEAAKRAEERNKAFINFMFRLLIVLIVGALLVGIYFGIRTLQSKRKAIQAERDRELAMQKWKGETMPDLIDLNNLLKRAMDDPKIDGTSTLILLKDLHADNLDAIGCLDNDDFNQDAIKRHVQNAFDFLERHGYGS